LNAAQLESFRREVETHFGLARAHLEFLWETLAEEQPDEEFVFHLLGQLYQVFFIHKGSPFSALQTDLLRRIVVWIPDEAADIKESAGQVLREMNRFTRARPK